MKDLDQEIIDKFEEILIQKREILELIKKLNKQEGKLPTHAKRWDGL